jgi:hypothetical protein
MYRFGPSEKSSTWTFSPDVGSGRTGHGRVVCAATVLASRSSTRKVAGSAESDTHTARFGPARR